MKKLTLLMAMFCLTIVAATAQTNSANSTIEGNATQVDIVQTGGENNVLNNAYKFSADGMNAISIPSYKLHLLNGTPLPYSPF